MRAICAFIGPSDTAIDPIARMLEARGYGTAAIVSLPGAALARLQRAGDDPADEPLTQGSLSIVADARLDDRGTLARAVGLAAARASDAHLILAAYRRWGDDSPTHLSGDFAFVIHDTATDSTFCARDHVGVRPFFYATGETGIAIASDMAAVLAAPGISPAQDKAVIAAKLLDRRYQPTERTWHRAVRRLPPGHTMRIDRGKATTRRYWFPERLAPLRLGSDQAYFDRLRDLLDLAVRDRLPRGDTIGVHISGGLDCCAVAAVATHALRDAGRPAPTGLSWNPPPDLTGGATGEGRRIADVRDALDLRLLLCGADADDIERVLRDDMTTGPDAGNMFGEATTQRVAIDEGIDVILSGWGGDEGVSFDGRGMIAEMVWKGRWRALGREAAARSVSPLRIAARPLVDLVRETWPARSLRWRALGRYNLVARRLVFAALPHRVRVRQRSVREGQLSVLHAGHVTARLEDWAIAGGRIGIDYRYPLLDRRVLEFAYAVPPELFQRGHWHRFLMRKTVESILPRSVVWNRSKADPERTRDLRATLDAVFQRIDSDFDTFVPAAKRIRWLKMASVRNALRCEHETRPAKMWQLRTAVQFLNVPSRLLNKL